MCIRDRTCNGFSNYQTWLVSLWYSDLMQGWNADMIEDFVNEVVDCAIGTEASFVRDLLDLRVINFRQLEEHFSEEYNDA